MPVRLPITFSLKPSQTSQTIVDATATTRARTSTTISKLEEELGPCEPPKPGLLSKLHIPKRKKPATKCPQGLWVTVWDYASDVDLPQSPLEDVAFPPECFPDHHASGEQDNELDHDVATPTNTIAWSSDGELTPQFSSNFPRTPHPNAFGD